MTISAQVSVYPLRQDRLSPAVEEVREALAARGLDPRVGPMSTVVSGEAVAVFDGLREAFQRAAAHGHVVMSVTLSNACPL